MKVVFFLGLSCALAACAASPQPRHAPAISKPPMAAAGPALPSVPELTPSLQQQAFEAVSTIVRDRFYDRTFKGLNWGNITKEHRAKVLAATDHISFHHALNEMVQRLGGSHISVAPPPLPGAPRGASLTALGIELVAGGDRALVQAVEPGSPAAAAGLRAGVEILSVDGARPEAEQSGASDSPKPFWLSVHQSLRGSPGSAVKLVIDDGSAQKVLTLNRATSASHGRVSKPSFRLLDQQTGVLTLSTFMIDPEPALAEVRAQCGSCTKLIIDLRGNGGGALPFLQKAMSAIARDPLPLGLQGTNTGTETVRAAGGGDAAFAGAVRVLIDGRSASSSEVFAAAVQDSRRGKVLGSQSAGGVLLSYIEKLPTGGSILFPVAEFRRSSGQALEGKGVTPDVLVVPTPADLREGRDAVLEAARRT